MKKSNKIDFYFNWGVFVYLRDIEINIMGTQSIVYGRICIKDRYQESIDFLKSLEDNENPFMRSEMFSFGSSNQPYYYDEKIVTFGASYKAVEYDWKNFVLKFEHILRSIKFISAKIKLETEFNGTYDFFWKSLEGSNSFEFKEKLIKTEEWYFGYGDRCMWGTLNSETDEPRFDFERFSYPIKITEKENNAFKQLVEQIDDSKKGVKQYPYQKGLKVLDLFRLSRSIFLIENFKGNLNFGFEEHKDTYGASVANDKKFFVVFK